jgi:hypothetical protein
MCFPTGLQWPFSCRDHTLKFKIMPFMRPYSPLIMANNITVLTTTLLGPCSKINVANLKSLKPIETLCLSPRLTLHCPRVTRLNNKPKIFQTDIFFISPPHKRVHTHQKLVSEEVFRANKLWIFPRLRLT